MRLLRQKPDNDFELVSFDAERLPEYAILSHTWGDGEVTYDELVAGTGKDKAGYDKIRFCGARAAVDGLQHFWIDTCCINKSDAQELQTAINSMFRWYQRAAKCYVHLSDVRIPEDVVDAQAYPIVWQAAFRRSRWFTRGWTLQELLAPPIVEFFSNEGKSLGSKVSLELIIHETTKLPVEMLRGQRALSEFSEEERLSWAANRQTKYKEDRIYSLFGIFGVFMPVNYGEGEDYALLRLRDEMKRLSKAEAGHSRATPDDLPETIQLPFPRNEFFVGRQDQLQSLEDMLARRGHHQRITIFGLGGCGKSALAIELAYRAMEKATRYLVFWVPAISPESFELAYREIGVKLRLPGIVDDKADVLQLVKTGLESKGSGDWLMIIDNADDASVILGDPNSATGSRRLGNYLPRSNRGRIIFTTRSRKVAESLTPGKTIKLGDIGETEARQLMSQRLTDRGLLTDTAAVKELLGLLEHLPLAIVQAVAFINSNETTIADYVSLFKEPSTEVRLFSKQFEDPSRYRELESTIAKTWHISFDRILKHDRLAADYLSFMACIDRTNIPLSLLPGDDPLDQAEAIGTLKGYAFITERQQVSQQRLGEKFFDVHRLVHLASMSWLQEHGEWSTWTEKAAVRLAMLITPEGIEEREVWEPYLSHAVCVVGFAEILGDSTKIGLLYRVGRCQLALGQYRISETTLRLVLAICTKKLGKDHHVTLEVLSNVAQALHGQAKYEETELLHRQVLATRKEVLGPKDLNTLCSMSLLGQTLILRGNCAEAESLTRQALAIYENDFDLNQQGALLSMTCLAFVLRDQGQYKEAESILRQILATEVREHGLGDSKPLATMTHLSQILHYQRRHVEAESTQRQVIASLEKAFGLKHPETLRAVACLAWQLAGQHRYAAAFPLFERACAGMDEVLGTDHPEALVMRLKLSDTLVEIKALTVAL